MNALSGVLNRAAVALVAAVCANPAFAMEIQDLEEALTGEREPAFLNATNRVAVFTFEDPDDTGLGDDVAFLSSSRILFDADVGSLAIVLYQEGLEPGRRGLSYFEKVDELTSGKDYIAAVWGRIARDGADLLIDSFVQFYPDVAAARHNYTERTSRFRYRFLLPGLSGTLEVSVAPRRIWVQSARIPADSVNQIRMAAASVRQLRFSPDRAAARVDGGFLGLGARYWITERSGDWRRVILESGRDGWTSVSAHCTVALACRTVISPVEYLISLLRYASRRTDVMDAGENATPVARAVSAQVRMLESLRRAETSEVRLADLVRDAEGWIDRKATPGGATFGNIRAIARLQQLEATGTLERDAVRDITDELARAVLDDPGNLDALHNLAVLFEYVDDQGRARLARRLYSEAVVRAAN